jgi:hypothetical protein
LPSLKNTMTRQERSTLRRQGLINWAEIVDAWRLWPRLFLAGYFYHLHHLVFWYMALANPTTEQTAMVGAVTALFVPLTKWYMENGIDWETRKERVQ